MGIKRRDFLKLAGVASTSLLPDLAAAEACAPDFDHSFGVLVDTTVCIGCRKCEWACDQQNNLSELKKHDFEDKTILKSHRRPSKDAFTVVNSFTDGAASDKISYMKVQCMHCNDPACVSACIVGALQKCPHGVVTYDAWKCIGCRYCMVACPFQVPAYEYDNALDPQVKKCTFCMERIHDGQPPACVEICPAEALTFGKRRQLIDLAHHKIKKNPERYYDHVYGEYEVGGTSWMYLASTEFVNTELPQLPADSMPDNTEKIQHGIFKSFIPPLALYGLLGLIMHSLRNDKNQQESE